MINSFRGEYRFLSNFIHSPITIEIHADLTEIPKSVEITYPTVEHAYQASKSGKLADWYRFREFDSPGQAKRAGKLVKLRNNWHEIKLDMMSGLINAKFDQNPELAKLLIATGDEELIEGNTWGDVYWGQDSGRGENNLGKILMEVRRNLL